MTDRKRTEEMKIRTREFALRIIKLFRALPKWDGQIVKKEKLSLLLIEANELLAIFAASQITARGYARTK